MAPQQQYTSSTAVKERKMDRLWAMQVFIQVVECGSFRRAAESLNMANASITSCIRNLERHLDVVLIQRNTRFLHLTDEGRIFFEHSIRLLKDVAEAEAEVRSRVSEISGDVRVEMPLAIGHELLSAALPSFLQKHPKLTVSMILTNDPRNIIERGTDVAIRMDAVEDADLVARFLYQSSYIVCGSPQFLSDNPLPASPAELAKHWCLGMLVKGRYTPQPWKFTRDTEKVVVEPSGPVHHNNSHSLIQAALQDLGLICVLDVYVKRQLASGQLQRVYADWSLPARTFYAVTPKARFVPPKSRAVINFLSETLHQEPVSRRPDKKPVLVRNRKKNTRNPG